MIWALGNSQDRVLWEVLNHVHRLLDVKNMPPSGASGAASAGTAAPAKAP